MEKLMEKALFTVVERPTGRTFEFLAGGGIRGFDRDSWIFNRLKRQIDLARGLIIEGRLDEAEAVLREISCGAEPPKGV